MTDSIEELDIPYVTRQEFKVDTGETLTVVRAEYKDNILYDTFLSIPSRKDHFGTMATSRTLIKKEDME